MKILSFTILSLILVSCGTRETIKNKYLYSETVMQLLSDQEYYNLDKESKWPKSNENFCAYEDKKL
tara:strand:+ start:274 stop:471 length:198 start_codon:yes stop_codon:yes gene_type:complete